MKPPPVSDWLFGLHKFGMKLELRNMQVLCELLGRPEKKFRSILVAGTNGKGSVAAMIEAILQTESGSSPAGLYTSPHLVRPEERIRIGGSDIEPAVFEAGIERLRELITRALSEGSLVAHPTFFEVMTALAFDEFARAGVGTAVLEVGLGGRLDATNVADPELSVVTTIDRDHEEQLGPELAGIAREKAGVLRSGRPAVIGESKPVPLAALRAVAHALGAPLYHVPSECRMELLDDGLGAPGSPLRLDLTTPVRTYKDLAVPLPGAHQAANAAVAVRAVELFSVASGAAGARPGGISAEAVRAGLLRTRWPGRLEWAGRHLFDCAHNPAGAARLGEALRRIGPDRIVLVFAAMRDKDFGGVAAALAPCVASVVLARPEVERAAPAAQLRAAFLSARPGLPVEDGGAVPTALGLAGRRASALAGGAGLVCVAGSIFLVGEAKAALGGGA